jgi:hypothetical protein
LAERDFAEILVSDSNENAYLLHLPRAVGSLHIYSAADYLAAIAALCRQQEVMLAPGALARSAFENAVHGLLVVDSRCPDARSRAARAMLADVAAAYYLRRALKNMVGRSDDQFKAADLRLKARQELAERSFELVEWTDEPSKWRIEDERYPSMDKAARSWCSWREENGGSGLTRAQAEGMYDALCLYTHPQSFSSREEARWGPGIDEPYWETDMVVIEKIALGAYAAVIDGMRALYEYLGWEAPELDSLASDADAFRDRV